MDVYFDDFKVSHTFSDVVFASDYYPFGLAMEDRKIEREQYRFGYQGQFAEKDEETGWNAFELRMYNSRISRWMAVDPYRQFASPYVGMGNNPVNGVDPDGGYFFGLFGSTKEQRQEARQLASIKGGEVLNITSRKNIAVTWTDKIPTPIGDDFRAIVNYTQDFTLENHLSYTEGLLYNAYQGDLNAVALLNDSGHKDIAFNLHLQGLRSRSGAAFFQFGFSIVTAPISLGMFSVGNSLISMGTNTLFKSSVNIAGRQAMKTGTASITALESSVAATNFLHKTLGYNPTIRSLSGGLFGKLPTVYVLHQV